MRSESAENVTYRCGTCDKPIKTGCYCSKKCAEADDPPAKPDAEEDVLLDALVLLVIATYAGAMLYAVGVAWLEMVT